MNRQTGFSRLILAIGSIILLFVALAAVFLYGSYSQEAAAELSYVPNKVLLQNKVQAYEEKLGPYAGGRCAIEILGVDRYAIYAITYCEKLNKDGLSESGCVLSKSLHTGPDFTITDRKEAQEGTGKAKDEKNFPLQILNEYYEELGDSACKDLSSILKQA